MPAACLARQAGQEGRLSEGAAPGAEARRAEARGGSTPINTGTESKEIIIIASQANKETLSRTLESAEISGINIEQVTKIKGMEYKVCLIHIAEFKADSISDELYRKWLYVSLTRARRQAVLNFGNASAPIAIELSEILRKLLERTAA